MSQPPQAYLYFEFEKQLAVRKGNWKYYRIKQADALYDLAADRHEDRDFKSAHPDVLAELRACVAREHRNYEPQPVPPNYDR